MPGLYATETNITPAKSRADIEHVLTRYGATAFAYVSQGESAIIGFELKGRRFRFDVEMPPKVEFETTATGKSRPDHKVQSAWEQGCRSRWRALFLVVKAKLEAVESGIVSFEDEFLAYTLLPDGRTMQQWVREELNPALERGRPPPLIPAHLDTLRKRKTRR